LRCATLAVSIKFTPCAPPLCPPHGLLFGSGSVLITRLLYVWLHVCRFHREWKFAFDAKIAKQEAESNQKKAAMESDAKEHLSGFHKQWNDRCAASKKANQTSEGTFIEFRDRKSTPDNEWEKIASLVDLDQKDSNARALHEKDIVRMRSLLIECKTSPVKAH
jgi:hypothetical protein